MNWWLLLVFVPPLFPLGYIIITEICQRRGRRSADALYQAYADQPAEIRIHVEMPANLAPPDWIDLTRPQTLPRTYTDLDFEDDVHAMQAAYVEYLRQDVS